MILCTHLRATGCHLSYRITVLPDTSELAPCNPSQ